MNKKKMFLAILVTFCLIASLFALFYFSGIIAQIVIEQRAWIASGLAWDRMPGLPSLRLDRAMKASVTKEGLITAGLSAAFLIVLALPKIKLKHMPRGAKDKGRKLMISDQGTHGTAAFLNDKEAAKCLSIGPQTNTSQDILGMTKSGSVITLPRKTPLNQNLSVCGASGTGKSRSISRNLIFQAVQREESIVVTDPKSELYESMSEYLRDNGYTVKVLNLVQMEHSDPWNCLGEVGTSELMAQTFVDIVLPIQSGDTFWAMAEQNLLKALVLYVAHEMPPERRNIGEVYQLLIKEDERSLKKKMLDISREHVNAFTNEVLPPSPAYAPFSLFLQASETVRTSVIIGLGSKLNVLQAKAVCDVLCYDGIDLELPGKQKCAYFCIVSDQNNTFEFVSSLFFSFLFIRLVQYADNYCQDGSLTTKVKFILDEFPNCCYIPDFKKKCSTIRSRGISVAIFFQNIGQMKNRYPNDEYSEIIGACDSFVFLGCTDMLTAEFISKKTGIASVAAESTTFDLPESPLSPAGSGYRQTHSIIRRPLMTPDEVLRFPPNEELIFIRGQKVYRAKRFDFSLHSEYSKLRHCKAIDYVPKWKQPTNKSGEPTEDEDVIDLDALENKKSADTSTSRPKVPSVELQPVSLEEIL